MNQEQDNNFNEVQHVDAVTDNGDISWLCPNCHTINQADKCVICGYVRKFKPVSRNFAINPWMVCSIVLIVLLLFSFCLLIGNASGDERNSGPSKELTSFTSKINKCGLLPQITDFLTTGFK